MDPLTIPGLPASLACFKTAYRNSATLALVLSEVFLQGFYGSALGKAGKRCSIPVFLRDGIDGVLLHAPLPAPVRGVPRTQRRPWA
jgi:hypothetical protein